MELLCTDWYCTCSDSWQSFFDFIPHNDLLQSIATVLVSFLAVALPISISLIANQLKEYKDESILLLWNGEKEFQFQTTFIPVTIGVTIVLQFLDFHSIILLALIVLWFLYCIYRFYRFIMRVIEYATKTDDVILEKDKETINGILEE